MKRILAAGLILIATTSIYGKADMAALMEAQKAGNHGTAVTIAKQNLQENEKENGEKSNEAGIAHNILGMLLAEAQKFEESSDELLKALEIFKNLPQTEEIIGNSMVSHNHLASSYNSMRQFDEALEHYEIVKTYREDEKSPEHDRLHGILILMGHAYRDMTDYAKSEKAYQEAYTAAPKDEQMIAFFSLLEMYEESKQYAKAIKGYEAVNTMFMEIKDPAPEVVDSAKEMRKKVAELEVKLKADEKEIKEKKDKEEKEEKEKEKA